MVLLCLLAIVALLVIANFRAYRSMQNRKARRVWWLALLGSWLIGGVIGLYGGFFFEYHVSERTRVLGAPIPAVVFQKEIDSGGKEHWIDFVTPEPILFAALNVPIMSLVGALPVCVAWLLFRPAISTPLRS